MTKTKKFIIFGFLLIPVSFIINETFGYLFLGSYTMGLILIGIYQLFKKIRNRFSTTKEDKYLDKLKNDVPLNKKEREDFVSISSKKAKAAEEKINNPSFHRTSKEEELAYQFSIKYSNIIAKNEKEIYMDEKDDVESLKKRLESFRKFKDYCYKKSKGAKLYFQDTFEYLHNTNNDCFSYEEEIIARINYLEDMEDAESQIINLLKDKKEIFQKDLHTYIDEFDKYFLRSLIWQMEKEGKIKRDKYKSTYKLYLNEWKEGKCYLVKRKTQP